MKEVKGRESVEFVFGVVADNWKAHFTPIAIAFIVPAVAFLFGQLNVFVIALSVWLLFSSWTSMLHRDMALSFKKFIHLLEQSSAELLTERLIAEMERKEANEE